MCLFPYVLSIWGGLFLLFYMVCVSSRVTPAAPLRSWMGRTNSQCQRLNSLFILANMLNLELSRSQKFVPNSLNDTPFEKWLLTSAMFIIITLFPLVFLLFSLFFLLTDTVSVALFFIYKICWLRYYWEDSKGRACFSCVFENTVLWR